MLGVHVISIYYIGLFLISHFIKNSFKIDSFLIKSVLIFIPFFVFYNFYEANLIPLSKLMVDEENLNIFKKLSYLYYNHLNSFIIFSKAKFFLILLFLFLFKVNKKLYYFVSIALFLMIFSTLHPNFINIQKKAILFYEYLFIFIIFYFFNYFFLAKKFIEKILFFTISILIVFVCKSAFDNIVIFKNFTLKNNFNYINYEKTKKILLNNNKKIIFSGTEENLYKILLLGGLNQKIKWVNLYNNEKLSYNFLPGSYTFIVDNPYFSSARIVNNEINQFKNNILINKKNNLKVSFKDTNDETLYLYFYNRSINNNEIFLHFNNKLYKTYRFKDKIKIMLPKINEAHEFKVKSKNNADFLGMIDKNNKLIYDKKFNLELGKDKLEYIDPFMSVNNKVNFTIDKPNNCKILSQKSDVDSLLIFDLTCY